MLTAREAWLRVEDEFKKPWKKGGKHQMCHAIHDLWMRSEISQSTRFNMTEKIYAFMKPGQAVLFQIEDRASRAKFAREQAAKCQ